MLGSHWYRTQFFVDSDFMYMMGPDYVCDNVHDWVIPLDIVKEALKNDYGSLLFLFQFRNKGVTFK